MADAAPQAFTFGALSMNGHLLKFTGQTKRRAVVQQFPKRPGGRVEDMERGPRRLEVELVFTGPDCAADYQRFEAAVHADPRGRLVHPIAGTWYAFCEGPVSDVDFSRALDEIRARVGWVEDELDDALTAPPETTDPATAAQNATASVSMADRFVGDYLGAVAKAGDLTAAAQAKVDAALAILEAVTSPVETMRSAIAGAVGTASSVYGAVSLIATKWTVFEQDLQDYIDSASDLFDGEDAAPGALDVSTAKLGAVEGAALALEVELLEASPTPAGAADAVGGVEEALASCYLVDAALKASRPPTILYTVPELTDLVSLAQRRYQRDALARAAEIMGMNRIPQPAAIPAGTRLRIPER